MNATRRSTCTSLCAGTRALALRRAGSLRFQAAERPVGHTGGGALERARRRTLALRVWLISSRSLDIPRSSTLALCNTLVEAGLLTRSAEAGYSLGPHVLELSRAYLAGTDIHRSFEQVLGREGALDEHTLVLSVLEHTDVVYVGRRLGRRAVSVPYELGMRLPANCTASGKVLLSELSDEEVRARFADGLQALTSHSIVDIEVLLRELERWRSAGFALDEQETALGMTCVGAAVMTARAMRWRR